MAWFGEWFSEWFGSWFGSESSPDAQFSASPLTVTISQPAAVATGESTAQPHGGGPKPYPVYYALPPIKQNAVVYAKVQKCYWGLNQAWASATQTTPVAEIITPAEIPITVVDAKVQARALGLALKHSRHTATGNARANQKTPMKARFRTKPVWAEGVDEESQILALVAAIE